MPARVVRTIAAPMIVLSVVLLLLGVFAAWNVNEHQQENSDLFLREMHAMLAIEDLHIQMRDVRYLVNRFLRTGDPKSLAEAADLRLKTDRLLDNARVLARPGREKELIEVVAVGYQKFFHELARLSAPLFATTTPTDKLAPSRRREISAQLVDDFTDLSDELLTNEVLNPLRECVSFDQEVVERANEASQQTAQHLKIGFLLLGICGCAAGLLLGTGIARAVGRSIVQLNVSVRDVVGKLYEVRGPLTISHTGGFQGIESDLRQLAEEIGNVVSELQQRETELQRSEQLARVGQLAAGLAHELRNPLMPMKMLVQAALEKGDDIGLKGRSLRVINDEIGRLEQSIQAFLDFARPPVPEKTAVDVNDVVQQVFNLVSGRADQQSVVIRLNLPLNHVVAHVDRSQIRQLILNLLLNSLDVLPNGGAIDVLVERDVASPFVVKPLAESARSFPLGEITEHDALRLANPRREMEMARSSGWFAVRIADNGPGIPPDLLDKLFEPFVTTKETGIGLGLSICQRIATAHQGSLTVHNRPSGGAEFVLSLPFGM